MKPLPFQIEDAAFLLEGDHRALWSEPGTGKTMGAVIALSMVKRSLTVAPASATTQWVRLMQARGLDADLIKPEGLTRAPPHAVVSWGLMARGAVKPDHLDALVLDEAHKAVRSDAQRTAAALALITRAERVWPLTGTPMIRYADDLWPLCNALWPEHLVALGIRTRSAFMRRFCSMRDGYVVGTRQFTLRTLHAMLAGEMSQPRVTIRRTLAEVSPYLPAITSRIFDLPLTSAERARVDSNLTPEQLARLEQAEGLAGDEDSHIASARRAMGLLKAAEAAELVREAPAKVIAVYWHVEVGDALERALNLGGHCLRLDGSTPQRERQGIVDAFNLEQGPKVLLLQMVAGGEAINPHEHCSHLVFVERDWSGATMEQALRRVRRMGQTRHQQVDFFDCDHPIEAAMRRTAARKSRDLAVLTGDAAA